MRPRGPCSPPIPWNWCHWNIRQLDGNNTLNFGTLPPRVFLEISHPRNGFVNATSARPKNVSENAEYVLLGPPSMVDHLSASKTQPARWLAGEGWSWSWQKPRGEAKRVMPAEANPRSVWAQRACLKHLQHHGHTVAPAAHIGHPSVGQGEAYNSRVRCRTAQLGAATD